MSLETVCDGIATDLLQVSDGIVTTTSAVNQVYKGYKLYIYFIKYPPMQDTATTVAPTEPAKAPATRKKATPVVAKTAPQKVAKKQPVLAKTEAAPKPALVVKTLRKAASKPSVKAAAKPTLEKPILPKKAKLVRDSFTIPKLEYTVLADLKQRAGMLSNAAKKSELIRAGIKALAAMSDSSFLAALNAVPTIKTGRPAKTPAR